MSSQYELDSIKEKISKLEKLIEEKKKSPKTKTIQYVVVKKINEVIPDLKAFEAMMIMSERKFTFEFRVEEPALGDCDSVWNTKMAGKSFEVINEREDFYYIRTENHPVYIRKEYVKGVRNKEIDLKVSWKEEWEKLQKLKLEIPELEKKIEIERIEEEKELERQKREYEIYNNQLWKIHQEARKYSKDIYEQMDYERMMLDNFEAICLRKK